MVPGACCPPDFDKVILGLIHKQAHENWTNNQGREAGQRLDTARLLPLLLSGAAVQSLSCCFGVSQIPVVLSLDVMD